MSVDRFLDAALDLAKYALRARRPEEAVRHASDGVEAAVAHIPLEGKAERNRTLADLLATRSAAYAAAGAFEQALDDAQDSLLAAPSGQASALSASAQPNSLLSPRATGLPAAWRGAGRLAKPLGGEGCF
jgi:hypothetical protein